MKVNREEDFSTKFPNFLGNQIYIVRNVQQLEWLGYVPRMADVILPKKPHGIGWTPEAGASEVKMQ